MAPNQSIDVIKYSRGHFHSISFIIGLPQVFIDPWKMISLESWSWTSQRTHKTNCLIVVHSILFKNEVIAASTLALPFHQLQTNCSTFNRSRPSEMMPRQTKTFFYLSLIDHQNPITMRLTFVWFCLVWSNLLPIIWDVVYVHERQDSLVCYACKCSYMFMIFLPLMDASGRIVFRYRFTTSDRECM